jgi:tRNA pseudouridine55 synthase
MAESLNGWLNILKPPGMTSHDVVAWLRRVLGGRKAPKVGHIGTLDPPASGVLPICIGKAARLSRFAQAHEKTYVFEMVLGIETDTLDYAGNITRRAEVAADAAALERLLPAFRGEITQTPPQFSAIHIQGVRAYELARRGETTEIPARHVTIHELRLLRFMPGDPPRALLEMTCSQGTYVRSLCADIGAALDCGAHVGFLARTAVGPFRLEKTWTLEEVEQQGAATALLDLDWPLAHLPSLQLAEDDVQRFCQGSVVEMSAANAPEIKGSVSLEQEYFRIYAVIDNNFLGIARCTNEVVKPEVVVAAPKQQPANSDSSE